MPTVVTEAIILRSYKLAEADKIIVAMTSAAGLVRGVARGARRLKSRFGASLELWTVCELAYFEKEGRELVTVKSAEIVRSSFAISRDPDLVRALDYMSELTLEFMPPHEANPHMFRMIKACVEAAQVPNADVARLVQYFEVWTLRLSGFLPSFRACARCRRPLTTEHKAAIGFDGVAHCASCATGKELSLSSDAVTDIRTIQRLSPSEYVLSPPDTAQQSHSESQTELRHLVRRMITRALEREPRGVPA